MFKKGIIHQVTFTVFWTYTNAHVAPSAIPCTSKTGNTIKMACQSKQMPHSENMAPAMQPIKAMQALKEADVHIQSQLKGHTMWEHFSNGKKPQATLVLTSKTDEKQVQLLEEFSQQLWSDPWISRCVEFTVCLLGSFLA